MKKLLFALSCAAAVNAADVGYSIAVEGEILKTLAPELSQIALIPAGADAHTYEVKPTQMAALSGVKLYLAIGVESEDLWLKKILSAKTKLVRVDENISKQLYSMIELSEHEHHEHASGEHASGGEHEHGDEHHHEHASGEHHDHDGDEHDHHHHHHHSANEYDVHVWTSLSNLKIIAQNISKAVAENFPELASAQKSRLQAFNERIDVALKQVQEALKDLSIRGFIDAHPSWGYFAKENLLTEYSLEIHGKEVKSKELIKLKNLSEDKKVCLIVNAPQFSDKLSNLLAKETNLSSINIDPLAANIIEQIIEFAKALSKHCR